MLDSLDLVCSAHLGWDFVYQRPQHLMSRIAAERRVFYIEPPVFDGTVPALRVRKRQGALRVVTPHLPLDLDTVPIAEALGDEQIIAALRIPLAEFLAKESISDFIAWYYSPVSLACSRQLRPVVTVYDCMDELAAFADGPARMPGLEQELLERADLVFTGGAEPPRGQASPAFACLRLSQRSRRGPFQSGPVRR